MNHKDHTREIPASEIVQKFRPEFTADDCIEELKRVAQLAENEDRWLTRRYFRNNAAISEGTWDRFFGTFNEFKKQAGLELNRGAHRLELQVARHAAHDAYRDLNAERASYEGVYLKPACGDFQTILGINDLHDVECDPFWRRVVIDTAKRVQPEKVVINGDIFDLPEFGKYFVDPRGWDVIGRIKWVHGFLEELREATPDAEIWIIEGNHEFRLLRHLADATPAMKVVLSDLHDFTVPKLLGLDAYHVNYVARCDLAAHNIREIRKEISKNYKVFYDCVLACHYPDAVRMSMPGWNGHHHSHKVETRFSPVYGQYEWHQFGVGHRREAEFCNGENWANGFGLIHVHLPTKSVAFEYVDVRDFAVVGGKFFGRAPSEQQFETQAIFAQGDM